MLAIFAAPLIDTCFRYWCLSQIYYYYYYYYNDSAIVFRPVDIFKASKSAKTGKACGVDGLAAEHFVDVS